MVIDQAQQKMELQKDVLEFMMRKEVSDRINSDYFEVQTQFNPLMRLKLYSWMNELAFRLHMKRQTFHLSINFADRFLEKIGMAITIDKL